MAEHIGRYEIRREIGRGGMATVYLAFDPHIRRQVAIKVLPRQFTHDPKYLSRFQQEAQTIAALEHPAIVPIYDFGEHDDAPYLVMRYMSGGTLRERLEGKSLTREDFVAALDRLAPALDQAHKLGIIHRDLKPANIFFDHEGDSYLGDFGIARMIEASQTTNDIAGTPAYMSPEQVEGGKELDGRSDVYALGVILYEVLTGEQPYKEKTPTQTMMAHVLKPVPNVLDVNPDLPLEARAVVEKAMAKDREERYATTAEFAAAVKALLEPASAADEAALAAAAVKAAAETPEVSAAAPPVEPSIRAIDAAAPEEVPIGAPVEPEARVDAGPPPADGDKIGGLPGWIWWAGALALVVIAVLGIRAILGGGDDEEPPRETAGMVTGDVTVTPTTEAAPVEEEAPAEEGGAVAIASPTARETPTDVVESESAVAIGEEVEEPVEPVVEVTAVPQEALEPVTLRWNWGPGLETIDPALVRSDASIDAVANLFMGLTSLDPQTGDVLPGLASSWEMSSDATVHTFNLRDDIPWVTYDPASGEWAIVVDEDGNERYVNALDVVYGLQRSIDPATASDYAYLLQDIANAMEVNAGLEGFTPDDVGVEVIDDYTVRFTLVGPAAYFPSITAMWVTYPQPQWVIEEWGDEWTEAGLIVTNGYYGVEEWDQGRSLDLIKNPLHPDAAAAQIERVEGFVIENTPDAVAMYEAGELDTQDMPPEELDRLQSDPILSDQLVSAPSGCTVIYGFNNQKAPFDDVFARRAFAQAIDRQSLIDYVIEGEPLAATAFAPPGVFGAPAPGETGLSYDPDVANELLGTYLLENGITLDDFNAQNITLFFNASEQNELIADAVREMWLEALGVDVAVEAFEWGPYIRITGIDTPIEEAPHIFRFGWCGSYADENAWVYEFFNVQGSQNRVRRNCTDPNCGDVFASEFDELTDVARQEPDRIKRLEIYHVAEEILAVDEVAYVPLYHSATVNAAQPWLDRSFSLIGETFHTWTIDQTAQLE